MGVEFVRGLQGDDLRDGVVATAKHLVGYGASEGGMNWAPARIGACELHDVYLHPFEAAVRTAGLRSVMNAYNEVDGMPCAADRALLTGLLRDPWQFDGLGRVRLLRGAADRDVPPARRGRRARRGDGARGRDRCRASADRLLRRTPARRCPPGLVDEETLDDAVRRVLATKFELGLFERPFVDVAAVARRDRALETQRALAKTIVRKSLVLLKNDGALPLSPDAQRIAVIGPNADELRHLFGDYCYPAHVESLHEMLEAGENVFSIARPGRLEFGTTMPEAPTIARCAARPLRGAGGARARLRRQH